MKTQLFTIQQYADLHEIGKRTLHFYDEIGLFSPAVKKENGYRYYSLAQGAALEMILTLRELDMPIEAIKQYMEKRNPEDFDRLLETKQQEISRKIKELKETKSLLSLKQKQMQYLKADLTAISVVSCRLTNYAVTFTGKGETNYIDTMIQHGKSLPHHLFNMELGTMNHSSNVIRGIYNHTDAVFSNMGNTKCNHIRPAGKFIRAFHVGDFNDLTKTYERIIIYCQNNHLFLKGYAYEIGINDLCVMNIEEYVTMIEIQIQEND